MIITAIDPGTTESGVCHMQDENLYNFGIFKNEEILSELRIVELFGDVLVIESINPYTMGMTTRDTLLWSGRFQEAWECKNRPLKYISRDEVRKNICGSGGPKINDKVIKQALVDRFAYGEKNYGKGTKKKPGFFYGFKDDVWSAFALAITYYDMFVKKYR